MSVDVLKRFWPKFLAGKARGWVLERVSGGQVSGGKFSVNLGPAEFAKIQAGEDVPPEAVKVELNISGMSIAYISGLPPVLAGAARLSVSGMAFAVDIPEGKIAMPSGKEIALSQGRFFIPDLRPDPQQGEITFKANGGTPAVLELLDHEPLGYIQSVGLKPDFLGGTAEGAFTLTMPLLANLEFNQIKFRGTARLNDAIAAKLVGPVDLSGGTLDVNVTEQSVEAKGEISIKGVPAELAWQRIFYAPDDRQPPIKVTARLDAEAREKLGIKVNHLVHGPTPITLRIARLGGGATPPVMNVQADLTDAQLLFGGLGWTKPAGRAATVQLDVVPKEDGSTVLDNLKILGDDIDIRGGIALDANQHLKEFYFSDFSVNHLTHIEISATVRDDQVLDIKAEGPSFDGRQFFQSLFSAGQLDGSAEPVDPFGVDLTARVGTVTGFYDATAKDVEVTMKKRNGRLVALDATAELNGKSRAAVHLEQSGSARLIKAEARDAGDAFRLVGFYPSVDGGEASLEVNLDAGGPGTKSGTLWARDFVVLGDSVVNDVLTDPNSAAVLGERKQEVTRQRIVFNQLRAPFSVGGGKFRLKDAYMNGPMLGATMRGTVDFKGADGRAGGHLCAAIWLELGARGHSHPRPRAGRPPGRGRGRHYLRHQRQARRPFGARQSDVGHDAGHLPANLRVHRHGAGSERDAARLVLHAARPDLHAQRAIGERAHTGRIRTCRFLPSESLITPSSVRSAEVRSRFSSETVLSFTLRPPPLIWRLASPVDCTKPASMLAVNTPSPCSSSARRHLDGRQACCGQAFLERGPRRLGGAIGGIAAMDQRGRLAREDLLRLVEFGAFQLGELGDLRERKLGEQLEEALDVAVLAVPPILPIVVGGDHVGVEPHGAGGGLAHLGAR